MSKQSIVTIKDILESIERYGKNNILTWDPTDFRDNKQKNKNAKFDCTWVPFKLKLANGSEVELKKLKFMKVLTASGAKLPQASGEDVKNLLIAFREFSLEEIMVGDYAPKQKNTDEDQKLENERATKEAMLLKKNTDDFNKAMEAIDLSYQHIADELKCAKQLGFTINKNLNKVKAIKDKAKKEKKKLTDEEINSDVAVFSIRQTSYEDPRTKEEVDMKYPLTRIKLMVSGKNLEVATESYNRNTGGYTATRNVFDARRKDASGAPVEARVKVNGRSQYLTAHTAGSFITYKSIIGGLIEFSCLVVSKFGISLSNKFAILYVKRHKSSLTEPTFTADEFKELHGSDSEDDEEEVEVNSNEVANFNDEADSDLEDDQSGGVNVISGLRNVGEIVDDDDDEVASDD